MADKGSLGTGLYFDDLAVGDTFRTMQRTIVEADLAAFVNLTWLTEALVTRSTNGIGQAIAGASRARASTSMLNGFGDAAEIEHTRARGSRPIGVTARYDGCRHGEARRDRGDDAQARSMRFGAVDVLVNNAGIQHVAPVDEFPVDKWDAIIAINLVLRVPHHARRRCRR